jgi:hypothetical protein
MSACPRRRLYRNSFQSKWTADRTVQPAFTRAQDSGVQSRSRIRALLTVLLVVVALSSSSSGPLSPRLVAQTPSPTAPHANHQMSAADAHRVSLAVDGAATPDAVPDEMAYALFLRALASPSPRRAERLHDVLKKAGLATADREAAANALGTFSQAMDIVAQQRRSSVPDLTIRTLEVQALETARQTIAQSVSSAGQALLDAHVRTRVKPRVKIFSDGEAKGVQ